MNHHPDCSDPERTAMLEHQISQMERQGTNPPKPTKLSEIDRLRLENTSLRLMNIGAQIEKLMMDRARVSREFDSLRRECLDRYGVDIVTTRIDEEGNFRGSLAPQQASTVKA